MPNRFILSGHWSYIPSGETDRMAHIFRKIFTASSEEESVRKAQKKVDDLKKDNASMKELIIDFALSPYEIIKTFS